MDTKELLYRIESLLAAKFEEPDFSDCFPVELRMAAPDKIEVFVDSDSGMTFAKCQQISRYIESYLDESALLGENYTLEVSSPGIDRPLQQLRQYTRNIGRLVAITLTDGSILEGELLGAEETTLTLQPQKPKAKHVKEAKKLEPQTIPFDQIRSTLVKIRF